jgi:hypothetical protein
MEKYWEVLFLQIFRSCRRSVEVLGGLPRFDELLEEEDVYSCIAGRSLSSSNVGALW